MLVNFIIILLIYLHYVLETGAHSSLGSLGTYSVAQAGLTALTSRVLGLQG